MDLLFLPNTVEKGPRFVHRTTFRAYHMPKADAFQYGGFYYIGKNAVHIEKLVNTYKRGYASEGLENVKAELLRNSRNTGILSGSLASQTWSTTIGTWS